MKTWWEWSRWYSKRQIGVSIGLRYWGLGISHEPGLTILWLLVIHVWVYEGPR